MKIAPLFLLALPLLGAVAQRQVAPRETFTAGILRVERFGNPAGVPLVLIPALFFRCDCLATHPTLQPAPHRYPGVLRAPTALAGGSPAPR
ncbi:MAG TPA: hypothetical protein VMF11_13940 [Candidatus Baltobacteraceae bacterium]|nr:hypothetical protein [Candidatus Baltobacteraceae bacterium]